MKVSSLPSTTDLYDQFRWGTCNVIAGENWDIAKTVVSIHGTFEGYELGDDVHTQEPLSIVTRNDDPLWSDFVNWVLMGLLTDEEVDSQQMAIGATNVFGAEFSNMFIDALDEVGGYKDLYRRHLEEILPRSVVNTINSINAGLMFSHPFGLTAPVAGYNRDGKLERLVSNGFLRCGVPEQTIFANLVDPPTGMCIV